MLKLILTLVLLFAIASIGFLLQRYDFPITAELPGYLVETSAARLAVILIVILALIYALMRLVFWLKNSPRRVLAQIRRENESRGYRNIMSGFSALAAGDSSRARKFAAKADKALPKQPLVKLLQAQIEVRTGNQVEAEKYYRALTLTEEGKFAGFRGLVAQHIHANEPEKALVIADDLLRDNPKSSWLNEALIDLAFRVGDWGKLERYLKKAEANRALDKETLAGKFAVYYYLKAKIAVSEGRMKDAEWLGERSLKYQLSFLPAAIILSAVYTDEGEYKNAKELIRNFWPRNPHPLLAKDYELALLNTSGKEKAAKVRKLYDKNPDDIDSIEFYAQTLIDEKQPEAAREVVRHGLHIHETKNLCLLMARLDDKIAWQARAQTALDEKCWHCRITGARYLEWQPYSDSGELNTIEWGFPPAAPKSALAHSDFLFIG